MTELQPKHLGELNSSRFFCPCGMGERDHCPGYHVEREKEVRASHKRSMLWLAIFLIGCAVMLARQLYFAARV